MRALIGFIVLLMSVSAVAESKINGGPSRKVRPEPIFSSAPGVYQLRGSGLSPIGRKIFCEFSENTRTKKIALTSCWEQKPKIYKAFSFELTGSKFTTAKFTIQSRGPITLDSSDPGSIRMSQMDIGTSYIERDAKLSHRFHLGGAQVQIDFNRYIITID